MKSILDLLKGTADIAVAPEPVKSTLRELDLEERALAAGGLPMAGSTITLTPSSSGGYGYDDSRDGYTSQDWD